MLGRVWFLGCVLVVSQLAGTALAKEPVTLEVTAQPAEITVGDPIRVLLTLRYQQGLQIEVPNLSEVIDPFEILNVRPASPQRNDAGFVVIQTEYTITAFSVGQLAIPAITLHYIDEAGNRHAVSSPALPVTVRSVIGDSEPEGLKDIKGPVGIPRGPLPYREWGATAALILGMTGSVIWLVRRLPRPSLTPVAVEEAVPPQEWAKEELDRIASLSLVEKGEYARHYDLMANCTRKYLAARYGSWALGCTTNELRQGMELRGVDRWQVRMVYGLLEECDAVRWARYTPAKARAEQSLAMAHEIIGNGTH